MKLSLTFLLTITVAGSHAFPLTGAPAIEERAELKPSIASSGSGSTPSSSASKSAPPKASGSASPHGPPPKGPALPKASGAKPKLATADAPYAPSSNETSTRPNSTSTSCPVKARGSDEGWLFPRAGGDAKEYLFVFDSEKYLSRSYNALQKELCGSRSQKIGRSSKSTDSIPFFVATLKPDLVSWIRKENKRHVTIVDNKFVKVKDPKVRTSKPASSRKKHARAAGSQSQQSWNLGRLVQTAPIDNIDGFNWNYRWSHDGTGVDIYVVDGPINSGHFMTQGRIFQGIRTPPAQYPLYTDTNHGTMVASVAAAVAKGAGIIPVAVDWMNSQQVRGTQPVYIVLAAQEIINMRNQYGRKAVVNISQSYGLAGTGVLSVVIAALASEGIPVTVAAGNSGSPDVTQWSNNAQTGCMLVGSFGASDIVADDTDHGPNVNMFAPGVKVAVASPSGNQNVAVAGGTSLANPHVAGVLAQIMEAYQPTTAAWYMAELIHRSIPNAVRGLPQGVSKPVLQSLR